MRKRLVRRRLMDRRLMDRRLLHKLLLCGRVRAVGRAAAWRPQEKHNAHGKDQTGHPRKNALSQRAHVQRSSFRRCEVRVSILLAERLPAHHLSLKSIQTRKLLE